MTRWTMKKKPGTKNHVNVFKTPEGKPEISVGDTTLPVKTSLTPLHQALIEMADFWEPGDVVVTPEGNYVVHEAQGEPNN